MANWTSIPCEVEILGLETILSDAGIEPPFNDFESVYATLSEDKDKAEVARLLEETVYHYFSSLELPDETTLVEVGSEGSANDGIGAAACKTYGDIYKGFGGFGWCLGATYLDDGDTPNIEKHTNAYLEGNWQRGIFNVALVHISSPIEGDKDENFVMAGIHISR